MPVISDYKLNAMTSSEGKRSRLKRAFFQQIPEFRRFLMFSLFVNVLTLSPALYMLQVYDRVVNSRNHTTLLMLTLLVVGLYILLEVFEWVRGMLMNNVGVAVERYLRDDVLHAVFMSSLRRYHVNGLQILNDMKNIRETLPSNAVLALFDVPLAMLILVLLFMIHPLMGWFAVLGALIQGGIGLFNERRMKKPFVDANQYANHARIYADGAVRNAQVIESMGMFQGVHQQWHKIQDDFLRNQAISSDLAGTSSASAKMMQSLISSLLLGIGCMLALQGIIGGSLMIVGAILGGRILAPVVRVIGGWRQIEGLRESILRLGETLDEFALPREAMKLPPPKGALDLAGVSVAAPGVDRRILTNITFNVAAGDSVAIVGPSGAGKSTLARLLVGVWVPLQGKVRLDSVDISSWNKDELGPHIGYLPQNIELFEGSLADNICRFGEPDREKVEEACRLVGLTDFVTPLSDGYDSQVGTDGIFLSGGQRQRVGLARAIYGCPEFVVLDEPNSSLDEAGDKALVSVLRYLKNNNSTVMVITQRKQILSELEYMLVLTDGKMRRFGRLGEVMEDLQQKTGANDKKIGRGR